MIEEYRKRVDGIDNRIVSLLSERFKVSGKIVEFKKKNKIKVKDKKREEKIVERLAKGSDLDKNLIKKFYKIIFKFSRKG